MKAYKFLGSIIMALLLWGCSEEKWIMDVDEEIQVVGSFVESRIAHQDVGNGIRTEWVTGDEIALITPKQGVLKYVATSSGGNVKFKPATSDDYLKYNSTDTIYAIYPYTDIVVGNDVYLSTLSYYYEQYKYQSFPDSDVLVSSARVDNGTLNLNFKHIYTFVEISLKRELLKFQEQEGYRVTSIEMFSNTYSLPDTGHPAENKNYDWDNVIPSYWYDFKNDSIKYEDKDKNFTASGRHNGMKFEYREPITDETPDSIIKCVFTLYPIDEGTNIIVSNDIDDRLGNISEVSRMLFSKPVPKGGFKAGHYYTISVTEDNSEELYQVQKNALMALYEATDGDNWDRNDNWGSDKPLSEWYGIRTVLGISNVSSNVVTGISLRDNNLIGYIPKELSKLKFLNELDLHGNELYGNIPNELLELKLLSELTLGKFDHPGYESLYKLTGEVPDFLANGIDLRYLSLGNNDFTGNLPDIGKNMESYFVKGNSFTGSIPQSHWKYFDKLLKPGNNYEIYDNQLSGDIPEELSKNIRFSCYWPHILPQKSGYGFDNIVIPAPRNTVECYDGTFINLGEEYAKNEYTLLFTWESNVCYDGSDIGVVELEFMNMTTSLYNKYKEKGLNVIGMTVRKKDVDALSPYFEIMPDIKHFWREGDNNENGTIGFYLLYYSFAPSFHIIDKVGNIIDWRCPSVVEGIPQHSYNIKGVFDYVAQLFGDHYFNPDYDGYTSTDYSKDGEVLTLQKAETGRGIDLVFMGDAFVDKDMEPGGLYEQKMEEAMEQFFSIEPYTSLRNRFNVYAVKVVSPNAEFMPNAVHRINRNSTICFEYVEKINKVNLYHAPMVSVIYNTNGSAGRSYTELYTDGTFVAYMMEGVNEVLIHESGGHGLAKLLDEYVEPGMGSETLPEEERAYMENVWNDFGWGANVDWRNDASTVKWSHFLNDSRYANEGLGLYEGAYLYGYGAYRPTENSMMRYNDSPFNAPSREQIYKRIMQLSEGENWKYDYEEFVKFDEKSRNAASRAVFKPLTEEEQKEYIKNHRPPRFIKGTWRDAIKNGKNNIVVPFR